MGRPLPVGLGFVSGRQVGRVVPLAGQPVLGRDPGSQVALPPEEVEVSARHAQFLVSPDGRVRVVDLHSKGGTWRDGERLPPGEAVALEPGTALRFGVQGPLVLFDELGALEAGRAELVLLREDGARGSWAVSGPLLIGRREGCQVRLDDKQDKVASGHHAHLMPAFGRAILTDLGSANGTWREARRVVQEAIPPGTRFVLGKQGEGPTFRLEVRGGAAPRGTARFTAGAVEAGPPGVPTLCVPEALCLEVEAAGQRGRVHLLLKTRVSFGGFAGLADLALHCFPREMETDEDARARGEDIAPEHGTLELGPHGFELIVGQDAPIKLDGRPLVSGQRVPLPDLFELSLGEDTLGLRGRQLRHPRLPDAEPAVGLEGRHPIEALVLERMGDGADHLFLLLVRQAVLGSSDEAAVRIPAAGVSPQHARVYVSHGSLWISQLGPEAVAAAGTVLGSGNATRIAPGVELQLGAARAKLRETTSEDFEPPPSTRR